MKNTGKWKFLIIVLIVLFGLKTLSEILLKKGTADATNSDKKMLFLSDMIFPISSYVNYKIGDSLLSDFHKKEDVEVLEKCIKSLKKSIKLNPLNFFSYYALARGLMSYGPETPEHFEDALKALKTTLYIRSTNLSLNKEILKVYLSLWPFLSPEDKKWSGSLMRGLIPRLNQKEFKKIMKIWSLYSKDSGFIRYAFNNSARFYKEIIDEMEEQELDLRLKQRFEAFLENRRIIDYENKFREAIKKGVVPFSSYILIDKYVRFYHMITKNTNFKRSRYENLKKEINLYIINKLIKKEGSENRDKLFDYIFRYLRDFRKIRDIEDIELFLNTNEFFRSNDIITFIFKQLINYRAGQISKMISEIESFRQSVTFIKDGQERQLARLLTLLADGYINSRLLTKAMDTLKDVEKLTPDVLPTYWRLIRIENIIGIDKFFSDSRVKNFEKIRYSNNIMIDNVEIKRHVYPYKVDKLLFMLDEKFSLKFKKFHILKVFINNKIFHEYYIGGLKFPLELSLPDELKEEEFIVSLEMN